MERYKCKLCFRIFANGRALGGHMRAHMINLYATKNSSKKDQCDEKYHSHSSQEDEEYEEEIYQEQSETELSTKKKRSKRVRKSRISSPLSSISEIITPDEDVAYCLMMMSRDKWGNKENDYISDDFGVAKVEVKESKVKGEYRCETCWRAFRSYQALGGHMASHKKVKVNAPPLGGGSAAVAVAVVEEKIHECPFCDRVFASGQALGGHKRSHFIIKQISRNCGNLDIDLNLPPPIDGDDDDNISH